MQELLKKSNYSDASMLTAESVAIMKWAINETIGGRIIVALDLETEEAREIISPHSNLPKVREKPNRNRSDPTTIICKTGYLCPFV